MLSLEGGPSACTRTRWRSPCVCHAALTSALRAGRLHEGETLQLATSAGLSALTLGPFVQSYSGPIPRTWLLNQKQIRNCKMQEGGSKRLPGGSEAGESGGGGRLRTGHEGRRQARAGPSRKAETRIRQHGDPGPAIESREARQPPRHPHTASKSGSEPRRTREVRLRTRACETRQQAAHPPKVRTLKS